MSSRSLYLIVAAVLGLGHGAPASAVQIRDVEVAVGGGTVHAICTDGPTRAILLHGDTGDGGAESWRPVLERLAGDVGACAYDRPGSLSAGERPREIGWYELLDRLRTVHAALGVDRGYTLVGHGAAGLYARLFAVDRPRDLGGLVLVDPAHEDMPREALPGMPEDVWSAWVAERGRPNADGVRLADLARRARGTRLPDIPVTVITATVRKDGDEFDTRFLAEAARRVHASILRGVRSARHIPATGSGHQIQLEAPELVADEVSRMVRISTGGER